VQGSNAQRPGHAVQRQQRGRLITRPAADFLPGGVERFGRHERAGIRGVIARLRNVIIVESLDCVGLLQECHKVPCAGYDMFATIHNRIRI